MDLRDLLVVLHIAGAGAWLGANMVQAMAPRVVATQGPVATAGWFRVSAALSTRLYMPASIVILVTGILLVIDSKSYGFGTPFVTVGMAMIVVGAFLGITVFAPGAERAADALESGAEGEARQATARLAGFGILDTVLLLITIAVMVVRWGA